MAYLRLFMIISPMKQQFFITRTIRQTEISASLDCSVKTHLLSMWCGHRIIASTYIFVKKYHAYFLLISIHLLTAVGLTPGSSSTVHIYTQTVHRTTQLTTLVGRLSGIRTQSGQTKINDELTTLKLSPNWE